MVDELLVQLGELGGGCAFGGPAAAGEDGVGELLCVLVGGVTVGPQAGDVDVVDAGGCGGRVVGRSAMSRPARSSSTKP
ncbi:hypothetical protein [Mycobacterium riyadhense]|uniref:hypothetical protein n=1 Tax=Mycobacterium riyadhense TaxID=486698 RepID=UPI001EF9EC58|nr:hypothetical protein [Mycobacterium riyadhense]